MQSGRRGSFADRTFVWSLFSIFVIPSSSLGDRDTGKPTLASYFSIWSRLSTIPRGDPIKTKRVVTVLVLAGSALFASSAFATNSKLTDDASTLSSTPNVNYGTSAQLLVSGGPTTGNSYIRFDLSSLPAGTTGSGVSKATLTLYVNAVNLLGSFDVMRVTSSWSESTITSRRKPRQQVWAAKKYGGMEVSNAKLTLTASACESVVLALEYIGVRVVTQSEVSSQAARFGQSRPAVSQLQLSRVL